MHEPVQHHLSPPRHHAGWGRFVHLEARFYMDYKAAILRAARSDGAVDVDVQRSADNTAWALHWAVVGLNKLHDKEGKIPSSARIENLHDEEIARLRSATGKHPHTLRAMLRLAADHEVRVEAELKTRIYKATLVDLRLDPKIDLMDRCGDLQIKTLANLGDPIARLRPAHEAGYTTLLTFTNYHGDGIPKSGWPYIDFVRGNPKWKK